MAPDATIAHAASAINFRIFRLLRQIAINGEYEG